MNNNNIFAPPAFANSMDTLLSDTLCLVPELNADAFSTATVESIRLDLTHFTSALNRFAVNLSSLKKRSDFSELNLWVKRNRKSIVKLGALVESETTPSVFAPTGIIDPAATISDIHKQWGSLDIVEDMNAFENALNSVMMGLSQDNGTVIKKVKQVTELFKARCKNRDLKTLGVTTDSQDIGMPVAIGAYGGLNKFRNEQFYTLTSLTDAILNRVDPTIKSVNKCSARIDDIFNVIDSEEPPTCLTKGFRVALLELAAAAGDYVTLFGKVSLTTMALQHNWIVSTEALLG